MSIKAIAFHESIATDRVRDFIESAESQAHTETQAGTCVKCNLGFAILLLVKSDPRNAEYVGHLNDMIAADCIAGHHRDEYILDESGPGSPRN